MFLTNADLDHVLGLFALREGGWLTVLAPAAVREVLVHRLGLNAVLNAFCGVVWQEPPAEFPPQVKVGPTFAGMSFRAIPLPGNPPLYAGETPGVGPHSVAYQFLDHRTGGRLLVAPDVAAVTPELRAALKNSDAVLFDGTFWSREELQSVRAGARAADEMGHVTIKDCSLDLLAKLPAKHKVYLHINNTNPVLALDSPERAAVEAAGLTVGQDGFEFTI